MLRPRAGPSRGGGAFGGRGLRPLLRLPVAPLAAPPPSPPAPSRAAAAVAAAAAPADATSGGPGSPPSTAKHTNADRSRLAPARRVPIRQLPAAARLVLGQDGRQRQQQQKRQRQEGRGGGAAANAAAAATAAPPPAASTAKPTSKRPPPPQHPQQQQHASRHPPPAFTSHALAAAAARRPPDLATLDAADMVFVNVALRRLGEARRLAPCRALSSYALSRADRNEHTYAACFLALASCGRLDLAVAAWRELASKGTDVGPIGASALLKAAGVAGDADAGVALLDELLRRRVTLNTAAYNALVHLCALSGRLDDALAAYNLSRLDPDPACRPNCFTYSALLGGLVSGGRPELGAELWRHISDDGVVKPDGVLWCQLIAAAGAAGDVELARRLLDTMDGEAEAGADEAGARGGGNGGGGGGEGAAAAALRPGDNSKPARAARRRYASDLSAGRAAAPAVNERHATALMGAFARGGDLDGCERAYRRLLVARGLPVDGHAASILLTAAARAVAPHASLARVEALRADLASRGAPLNAHVATALIGAYRNAAQAAEAVAKRDAVLGPAASGGGGGAGGGGGGGASGNAAAGKAGPAAAAAAAAARKGPVDPAPVFAAAAPVRREALRRALEVLERLRAERRANANVYTAAAAFAVQAGALGEAARLGRAMRREGVVLARPGIQALARACIDVGLGRPGVRMERLLENVEDDEAYEEEGEEGEEGGDGGGLAAAAAAFEAAAALLPPAPPSRGAWELAEEEARRWRIQRQLDAEAASRKPPRPPTLGGPVIERPRLPGAPLAPAANPTAAAAAAAAAAGDGAALAPPAGQGEDQDGLPLPNRRARRGAAAAAASQGAIDVLIGLANRASRRSATTIPARPIK